MKEINGTVTLAFVEEDNKQRVIFRIFPLCTREGGVFNGGAEDFPDEGSMRVVPDKREQSTFKERMRSIGGLCAIYLINGEGKELVKVRQNRNYAPEQGEKNKLAIYSDVICEFTDGGCYEVLDMGADVSQALTEKILLHKNKVLYGPIKRDEAASANEADLRPFGNDRFLLHAIEMPLLGKHQIYWDPEAILNWRQRRNTLRHRERGMTDESVADDITVQDDGAVIMEQNEQPARVMPIFVETGVAEAKRVEQAVTALTAIQRPVAAQEIQAPPIADAPDEPSPKTNELKNEAAATLPIGTKLDILDNELTFDQQISRLEQQSLSMEANRLTIDTMTIEEPQDEPAEPMGRFSGTPLVPGTKPLTRSVSRSESVHHVVERQLMRRGNGDKTDDILTQMMDNPIDSLRTCIDYVWQNADMRRQAIDVLCENETFMRDMLQTFRQHGLNTRATAAAQEQLAEIEAERLSLLMQLETAKNNEKKYRQEAIESLSQKFKAESERLKQEIKVLNATKAELTTVAQNLSGANANQLINFIGKNVQCLSGASEDRILLSPVIGCHYTAQELAEKLRLHMNESGYGINEDEAMNLLIFFSINDAICLKAKSEIDAARFAQVILESFGLQSVSGRIQPNAFVEVVSLLPENGLRTPTVTVQTFGTESMSIYGHKTMYLLHQESQTAFLEETLCAYPVINVPSATRRAFARGEEREAVTPASLESFTDIRADVHPMQDEAAKWFENLKMCLENCELALPQTMLIDMSRFIEVASYKVRGGFLSAADSAVCHWVIPALLQRRLDGNTISAAMAGLPRALEMLRL